VTALVNGVAVAPRSGESVDLAAVRELLRQRAVAIGVIDGAAKDEDQVSAAIETLLEREVVTPEPTEGECRRYYERRAQEFASGDLVCARHILFQVTPGVDVGELRARAEATLMELLREPDRFAAKPAHGV